MNSFFEISFCLRNMESLSRSLCGTTIGPTTSGKTCVRTIDIGNPQLSMHSIREVCGTKDVAYMTDLIYSFFTDFAKIVIN